MTFKSSAGIQGSTVAQAQQNLKPTARPRLFIITLLIVIIALAACVVFLKTNSPKSLYLASHTGADWIVPGAVKSAGTVPNHPTICTFEHTFEVTPETPQPLTLQLRTLGNWRARVGPQLLGHQSTPQASPQPHPQAGPGKLITLTLAPLPEGQHRIAVQLTRDLGPTALWCQILDAQNHPIAATNPSWLYSINGATLTPARLASNPWLADDTDPFNTQPNLIWGAPLATTTLALVSLLSLIWAVIALRRAKNQPPPNPVTKRHYLTLVISTMTLWTLLFTLAALYIPPDMGFDAKGHLQYIQHIADKTTIPLADEGWQMYQPPAYYLLTGYTLKFVGLSTDSASGILTLRVINWLLAMSFLAISAAALARLCRHHYHRASLAFLLLACCPVCFYVFCYFTNENLHTVSAALVLLLLISLRGKRIDSWPAAIFLGAALGLALLSKVTALLLVIPICMVYGLRIVALITHTRWSLALHTSLKLLTAFAAAIAVSGWYYLKVWQHFGTPLVTNWDPASGNKWWQVPGYRVIENYTPNPSALTKPLYAGLDHITSGVWTTWAGDALLAGAAVIIYRPTWNYWAFPVSMSLTLILFTLALVGVALRLLLTRRLTPNPVLNHTRPTFSKIELSLAALIIACLFAIVYVTLEVPANSQAKSFFVLAAVVPICYFAAVTLTPRRASNKSTSLAAILAIALPWAVTLVCMFTVLPTFANQSVWATREHSLKLITSVEAIKIHRAAVQSDPENWPAKIALAYLLLDEPDPQKHFEEIDHLIDTPALRKTLDALQSQTTPQTPTPAQPRSVSPSDPEHAPQWPHRLAIHAQQLALDNQLDQSAALLKKSLEADPANEQRWLALVTLLEATGQTEQAQKTARQAMVYFPWSLALVQAAQPPAAPAQKPGSREPAQSPEAEK